MTVKEIKQEYEVLKRDGRIQIHAKEPNEKTGMYSRLPYLCTIIKKGASFRVDSPNTKFTTKLSKLKEQIEEHVNSLNYPSGLYDPTYRKGFFEEMVIRDYLDSLGFKSTDYIDDTLYFKYNKKSVYGYNTTNIEIRLSGLDMFSFEKSESINIRLFTSECGWMSIKSAKDVDSIKATIDSLLKPLFLSEGVNNINTSEEMEFYEGVDIIKTITKDLNISSESYKKELKEKLLEIVDKL